VPDADSLEGAGNVTREWIGVLLPPAFGEHGRSYAQCILIVLQLALRFLLHGERDSDLMAKFLLWCFAARATRSGGRLTA
jgi:hypothetical protein